LANEEWATEFLAKVQYPYPVSGVAVAMAIAMMRNRGRIEEWIGKVRNERLWLTGRLRAIPGTVVVDSEANFLMASLPVDSDEAQKRLLAAGVSTRKLGDVLDFSNCLRITVGTRRMNKQLLDGLRGIVAK
jgi:histidinol-phosphate aminotransferase